MTEIWTLRALALAGLAALAASPLAAQATPDPAAVDAAVAATFSKAPEAWRARIVLDETQRACTATRNQPSSAEAAAILAREAQAVAFPADGKLLGDWRKGHDVANAGRGHQFSDGPNTVPGGNCYACHQMDPKEVSYGTLGPPLAAYGKDRNYDPDAIKTAWTKIWNSQAVVACSNMPRFGAKQILSEQQIKDVMAYLFDPESPVNK